MQFDLTLTATTAPFQVALYTRPELPCKAHGRVRALCHSGILSLEQTRAGSLLVLFAIAEKEEQVIHAPLVGAVVKAMAASALGNAVIGLPEGYHHSSLSIQAATATASLLLLAFGGRHTASEQER